MNDLSSPTFCVLPWLHMATYTNGAVLLCCVAKDQLELNLNHTSLPDAWNSSSMRDVRKKMLAGETTTHCELCYTEERNGARSHRQAENAAWTERLGEDFIRQRVEATERDGHLKASVVALDLRLGNTCNLQCVMCRPQDSTRWVKFGEELARNAEDPALRADWESRGHIDASRFGWFGQPTFMENFTTLTPDLRELIVGGGEPFLLPEHDQLLDVCLPEASHIRLRYHTNGTVIRPEIFDKWKRFQEVECFISIDGTENRNEYLRHPSSWEKLTANLRLLDGYPHGNLRVVILASIHLLNFFYIGELSQWIQDQDFKLVSKGFTGHFLPGLVHHPSYLSIQNYPEALKTQIEQQISSFEKSSRKPSKKIQGVVQFMKRPGNPQALSSLREYIQRLDAHRGTRFDQVFPELNQHLQIYGES